MAAQLRKRGRHRSQRKCQQRGTDPQWDAAVFARTGHSQSFGRFLQSIQFDRSPERCQGFAGDQPMPETASALDLILGGDPTLYSIVRLSLFVSLSAVAIGAAIGMPLGAL